MAMRKVGIPNVRGFLVPNSHLLDLSELASTESDLIREGPQSVIDKYWAPSSACWALDEMWLATSAPAPIRRPALSHFELPLRVPSSIFLLDLVLESFGSFFGKNLIPEACGPL